jgi:hypothetical protein
VITIRRELADLELVQAERLDLGRHSASSHRTYRQRRANHRDPVMSPHLAGGKPGSGPPPGRKFQQRVDMASSLGSAAQPTPAEGRSSVSIQQRGSLEAIPRQAAFPVGSDVKEQRRLLRKLTSAQPLPADVTVTRSIIQRRNECEQQ